MPANDEARSSSVTFAPFASWPGRDASVSVATWAREVAGFANASLVRAPAAHDAARGCGEPVIVVPGFCSPDISIANLRRFLLRQGFAARSWGCGINLGPARGVIARLANRAAECAALRGRKVSLVGISLGGTLAREAAKNCSDCVERVVTLVSPINPPVVTPLAPFARMVAAFWDEDAKGNIFRITEPPPVPVTAIVSAIDGVVDWRACLPHPSPLVETVMIAGAHMTMGSNPEAQRIVAARLAGRC